MHRVIQADIQNNIFPDLGMLSVLITDLNQDAFKGNIQEMYIINDIAHPQFGIGIKEYAFEMTPFIRVGHKQSTVKLVS
jgi:hypothetical protein